MLAARSHYHARWCSNSHHEERSKIWHWKFITLWSLYIVFANFGVAFISEKRSGEETKYFILGISNDAYDYIFQSLSSPSLSLNDYHHYIVISDISHSSFERPCPAIRRDCWCRHRCPDSSDLVISHDCVFPRPRGHHRLREENGWREETAWILKWELWAKYGILPWFQLCQVFQRELQGSTRTSSYRRHLNKMVDSL